MFEAIIAAVAGVLGAGLGSWATVRASRQGEQAAITAAQIARKPRNADLEVVDISCVTADELESQDRADLPAAPLGAQALILDVKLRNSGGETAFIHQISLCVRDVIDEFTPELPQRWDGRGDYGRSLTRASRVSGQDAYEVKFGQEQRRRNSYHRQRGPESFVVEKNISQEVRPGEIDRFLVMVWDLPLFFCADAIVTYNATREAKAPQGLKCLQPSPRWSDADSMLRALSRSVNQLSNPESESGFARATVTRDGQVWATWRGEEMPLSRAVWQCLAAYESFLQKLSGLYVEVGREVHSEFAKIQQSISEIPRIKRELGLQQEPE